MKFEELDDVKWSRIEPHLPPKAKEGKPRADDRRTINGMLYVLVTGCRWADLPKRYGDDSTTNRRLRRWEKMGIWKRIMDALVSEGYGNGKVKLDELSVDSSTIRARKGGLVGYDGHHRVKGTKLHAIVTTASLPVCISISPGNHHEASKASQ